MKKLLKADGTIVDIKEDLTLEVMQKIVGGYIEIVTTMDKRFHFVCDEEGKLKGYDYNMVATGLGREMKAIFGNDFFVGDIIIADFNEIK